jgi:preprotein translocase subunit SecD
VAIVVDGVVVSAPAIQSAGGIAGGIAQITGDFTETEASNLAAVLRYGSLPARLRVVDTTTTAS